MVSLRVSCNHVLQSMQYKNDTFPTMDTRSRLKDSKPTCPSFAWFLLPFVRQYIPPIYSVWWRRVPGESRGTETTETAQYLVLGSHLTPRKLQIRTSFWERKTTQNVYISSQGQLFRDFLTPCLSGGRLFCLNPFFTAKKFKSTSNISFNVEENSLVL